MRAKKLWLPVGTIEEARAAASRGTWAALVVACLTATIAGVAGAIEEPVLGLDTWSFLDAALFLLIAFGIHRMSRFAALSGLIVFVLDRVLMIETLTRGSIVTLFIALAFTSAVRGTFAYRRLVRRAPR